MRYQHCSGSYKASCSCSDTSHTVMIAKLAGCSVLCCALLVLWPYRLPLTAGADDRTNDRLQR
jgi:hypothetical protein